MLPQSTACPFIWSVPYIVGLNVAAISQVPATHSNPSLQALILVPHLPPTEAPFLQVLSWQTRPMSHIQKGSLPQFMPNCFFSKHLKLSGFPTQVSGSTHLILPPHLSPLIAPSWQIPSQQARPFSHIQNGSLSHFSSLFLFSKQRRFSLFPRHSKGGSHLAIRPQRSPFIAIDLQRPSQHVRPSWHTQNGSFPHLIPGPFFMKQRSLPERPTQDRGGSHMVGALLHFSPRGIAPVGSDWAAAMRTIAENVKNVMLFIPNGYLLGNSGELVVGLMVGWWGDERGRRSI